FEAGDEEAAFRAAHTLKGVAKNLGFSDLGESASVLTEVLRNRTFDGASPLFEKVKSDYARLTLAISSCFVG
ncbi:MAG: Hpt domain-containing protein, partial [Eubacteriales bacterium]|nr:Hpt domain-containing protein [Eubacteriales bacterium]